MSWQDRTVRLIGEEAAERLKRARVAVFGVGGVGSFAAEALVRAGVGTLLFVDGDCVEETNLNRQLIATRETLGMPKAEAARARALSINPDANVVALSLFYDEATADRIDLSQYDFVADCIDSVPSKLLLIERAKNAGCRVVCAMGAGNKLDPTAFEVADIEKTTVCPLARTVRQQLRKRGVRGVKAVFSRELPYRTAPGAPGSISFVPGAAGLALAGEILREIAEVQSK